MPPIEYASECLEKLEGKEKIQLSRPSKEDALHGTAQWESIMKKFHESNKRICNATPKSIPTVNRSKKQFPTGSSYEGSWNLFGMSGNGTYVFPRGGVKYIGEFKDGMFHGEGELHYDCGAIIKGRWKNGVIQDKTLFFGDGLEYNEQRWLYCNWPDRRYTIEYDQGLEPAGRSYLTAEQPPIDIPEGYYDVGDGYYEPGTKTVYKYHDLTAIVRSPCVFEQNWIVENCRRSKDIPVGPMPFFYEDWVAPTLELEFPPPPSARTRLYQEEEQREREEREVFKSMCEGRRRSRMMMTRSNSKPLFTNVGHSKWDYTSRDFYRPSYISGHESRQASHSHMNEIGVLFSESTHDSFKDKTLSRQQSRQTSRQHSKTSRAFSTFNEASRMSKIDATDYKETRDSTTGYVPVEPETGVPNW